MRLSALFRRAHASSVGAMVLALFTAACGEKADLVILGGTVWTGAATGAAQPGAVAIKDGLILEVADSADIARYIGKNTEVLDAAGGLVMPGFGDSHTHFVDGGFQLASIDLRDAVSVRDALDHLGAAKVISPRERRRRREREQRSAHGCARRRRLERTHSRATLDPGDHEDDERRRECDARHRQAHDAHSPRFRAIGRELDEKHAERERDHGSRRGEEAQPYLR